jgi:hypothetical protein
MLSEAGALLGYAATLEMNRQIINRVLSKIAKGLYYLETGAILPQDIRILMDYAHGKPERFVSPPLDEAIKGARRVDLGDGVVTDVNPVKLE